MKAKLMDGKLVEAEPEKVCPFCGRLRGANCELSPPGTPNHLGLCKWSKVGYKSYGALEHAMLKAAQE